MAHGDKHEDDYDGLCWHAGRAIVGILVGIIAFIIVLALVFWLVRLFFGIAFGIATWSLFTPSFVVGVIIFIIVLCIIFWLIRLPFRIIYGGGSRSAIRILRRRYARGEINEAQFKRMMRNLKEHY